MSSFSMTMGNSRIDRIKLLQMEKLRNQKLRKTGGVEPQKNVQGHQAVNKSPPNITSRITSLSYIQCPYCKQQILSNNLHHHISFCRDAYRHKTQGKCTACELFRKK